MTAIIHGRPPGPTRPTSVETMRFGPAGVLEQLADHRAEGDEHADRAGGGAEAGDEAGHDVGGRHGRHGAEHGRTEHEGQERVELDDGDQQDDGRMPSRQASDELGVTGIRLLGRRVGESGDGRGQTGGQGVGSALRIMRWVPFAVRVHEGTVEHLGGVPSFVTGCRARRAERLERGELARQERRGHVVPGPVLHAVLDQSRSAPRRGGSARAGGRARSRSR